MIKAIETEYRGYRFRSRLEARWAVFFDACGVKWEYEPEGYDLDNGLYYLPDFLLHNVGIFGSEKQGKYFDLYVEVKGNMTEKDSKKINSFCTRELSDDYILDGMERSYLCKNPIILVGNIPKNINDMIDAYNHSIYKPAFYDFRNILPDWTYSEACLGYKEGDLVIAPIGYGWDYYWFEDGKYSAAKKTEELLAKAGSARFEHGEKPNFERVR